VVADVLTVQIRAFRFDDAKQIEHLKFTYALNDAQRVQLKSVLEPAASAASAVPAAGANGYSSPSCDVCGPPEIPKGLKHSQISGTVYFDCEVGVDGRPHNIVVMRALPNGRTESAVAALQKWTFKPATGPDGKPAATRQTIEIQFRTF
jgi:TonB family protein